jgi:hypothetical protein
MPKHQDSYYLDLGGSFLKELPPSIKRYTYCGNPQFFAIFQSEVARFEASRDISEFLLFHTSKEAIETISNPENDENEENEDTSISQFYTSFDINEQLLLVTMSPLPHNQAVHIMDTAVLQTLMPMGLSKSILGYRKATITGNGRGKVPGYGWGPLRPARGQPRSPTVTLEVAFSGAEAKLNSDVRFWLNPDNGNANRCLTLRINRSQPEIRIEMWERRNDRIHRSQVTLITEDENQQTNVTHSPFVIPFESLFCRQPSGPRETDLLIPQLQLEVIAQNIWAVQDW